MSACAAACALPGVGWVGHSACASAYALPKQRFKNLPAVGSACGFNNYLITNATARANALRIIAR